MSCTSRCDITNAGLEFLDLLLQKGVIDPQLHCDLHVLLRCVVLTSHGLVKVPNRPLRLVESKVSVAPVVIGLSILGVYADSPIEVFDGLLVSPN